LKSLKRCFYLFSFFPFLLREEERVNREELRKVRKRLFGRRFILRTIMLPRQARDNHRESTQKWRCLLTQGIDLDGDGDIGVKGTTTEERRLARAAELAKLELDAEKQDDKMALRAIRRELRATAAAKVHVDSATDNLRAERNRLWKEELLRTEQKIVLFTIQEFVEVRTSLQKTAVLFAKPRSRFIQALQEVPPFLTV